MKHIIVIIFLMFFFSSTYGLEEYYRYVDDKGKVHYTDDLSRIPEEYSSNVRTYDKLRGDQSSNQNIQPQPAIPSVDKEITKRKTAPPKKTSASMQKMNKKLEVLKQEYGELMKEKEVIDLEIERYKKRYKTRIRKSVARAKIKDLNTAILNEKISKNRAERKALIESLGSTAK